MEVNLQIGQNLLSLSTGSIEIANHAINMLILHSEEEFGRRYVLESTFWQIITLTVHDGLE